MPTQGYKNRRTVGLVKLNYPLSLGRGAGVRGAQALSVVGWAKRKPAHRYKMFLLPDLPAQSAGEGDTITSAVVYHCLTVG